MQPLQLSPRYSEALPMYYRLQQTLIDKIICQDWKAGKSEPSADQLQIVAAALGTTPAYLTGATDKKMLPTGAPSGEEDPLDAQLRELLSHADDDLKQAMIAFLERFQKK